MSRKETLQTVIITHPCFDTLYLVATEAGPSRPATAEEISLIQKSEREELTTGATS